MIAGVINPLIASTINPLIAGIINPSSAGIGRTGVFIAVDIGMQHIDSTGDVDIPTILSGIRQDRGGLIQSEVQYVYVYQVRERGGGERREGGLIQSEVQYVYVYQVRERGGEGERGLVQSENNKGEGRHVCMCTIRVRGYDSAMGRCLGGRRKRKDILQMMIYLLRTCTCEHSNVG